MKEPGASLDPTRYPILVVDDEADNLDAFRFAFRRQFRLEFALGADEARALLDDLRPAVVVSDQRMPGTSGIELLREVRERLPTAVGVLLTAYTDLPVLLDAIHSGAVHRYVQKPWDAGELGAVLRQCLERHAMLEENAKLREQVARYAGYLEREHRDPMEFGALVGTSRAVARLNENISLVAGSDAPVLLRGEAGSGKRVVARAIHVQSEREGKPFVELLASGYPVEAQARELAGWRAGAAPGALAERAGRLELAHRGTLLVEEVAALGLEAQAVLLRAIEDGAVVPAGASAPTPTNARIIATTAHDLDALEADGTFLPALRSRLSVFPIDVPTLRERTEDLPALAEHVLARLARRNPRIPRTLAPAALAEIQKYDFPGNVRELENVLERAAILCRGAVIEPSHLLFGAAPRRADAKSPSLADGTATRIDLGSKLEDIERRELLAALERCNGNKAEVARTLGVQRTTLYYRLKRLGIDV